MPHENRYNHRILRDQNDARPQHRHINMYNHRILREQNDTRKQVQPSHFIEQNDARQQMQPFRFTWTK